MTFGADGRDERSDLEIGPIFSTFEKVVIGNDVQPLDECYVPCLMSLGRGPHFPRDA